EEAPGSAEEILRDSTWHIEGDEATVLLAEGGPRGPEVAGVELLGTGRQAILKSTARDPDEGYEVRGARISADRRTGRASIGSAPGTVSRQLLAKGGSRVEARSIQFDELLREARTEGEVVLARTHLPSGELALQIEAQQG